jgi:Cft2 family RNA processing exonuclease
MNEPDEITGMKGNTIPRKISVDYISFSAHVDYSQNSEFIDLIKAPHIVRSSNLFSPHQISLTYIVGPRAWRTNGHGSP